MITTPSLFRALLAGSLLLVSSLAIAGPFSISATSTISPCPSFCGGVGGQSEFDSDGGEGALSSFSSISNVDGNGAAQGIFQGPALLPLLRAEAFSNSGFRSSRVAATATGMQQYDYSGAGSTVNLSALVTGTTSGEARITSSIVVIKASNGADVPVSTDYGTLVFEILDLTPDLENLGDDRGFGAGTRNVSFDVNDGDSIFVWSQLAVSGTRGGSADAFDTMTLAFDDPTGFNPILGGGGPAPVTSPGSLALLGIGLLGLALQRRRRAA